MGIQQARRERDMFAYRLKSGDLETAPRRISIENAAADLVAQTAPDTKDAKALVDRYRTFVTDPAKPDQKADPKVKVGNFDGNAEAATELDAVVAYLQMLGTLVDFASFDATGPNLR